MRISAIDIGTNTILMLVADVTPDGQLTVVSDEHAIARLGQGVDERRSIAPDATDRSIAILRRYKELSARLSVNRLVACGTSALRDAADRDEFIRNVRDQLGMSIEVLSGDEEAELTLRGAASAFHELEGNRTFAVLDIGGGSTELTVSAGGRIRARKSVQVGSVRTTERFLKSSPPSPSELADAAASIRLSFNDLPSLDRDAMLIAVAGTATTLAAVDLRLNSFDAKLVDGYRLQRVSVERLLEELRSRTVDELRRYPQILPGREDIIVAGALILFEALKRVGREEIVVSTRGLRYGIALREASRKNPGV
jgi:exopolyphosphatase/guanosine-5'-triphosphate,3'-diphosphate pyrophosphatase